MNICLMGTAPGSVHLAPFDSPDWHIWSCSPGAYPVVRNARVWFELHRYEPGQPWFSKEYCEFLANFPGPVIMAEHRPEIPNSVAIDYKSLTEKYSEYFFTSSLSWMMALAINAIEEEWARQDKEGVPRSKSKIALFGVDMAANEEYWQQRMGCQVFCVLARNMGIEVGVPPESDLLCPAPLYGICEVSHVWIKHTTRTRELNQRLQHAEQEIAKYTQELHFLHGALDDMNWQRMDWFGNTDTLNRKYCEPPLAPGMALAKSEPKQIEHKKVNKTSKRIAKKSNGAYADRNP